jgi:peptide/nickel transport system substrate-binding protein
MSNNLAKCKVGCALAAVILASAVVIAISNPNASAASARATHPTGSVTWAIAAADQSLDPGIVYYPDENSIAFQECDSLVKFGPQDQLEPDLASSWMQTSPTTYVYNLVHNAKFWDGNPVTATDVAFSINRLSNPTLASPLLSLVQTGNIKDVVANGKWQVTIRLTNPNPIAPELMATPVGQVVEESAVKEWGSSFGSAANKVMCSGPYRPVTYVKGAETVLDAVPSYWNKSAPPTFKQITFETIVDAEALEAGLRSGAITGTFDLDAREALSLEHDSKLDVQFVRYAGNTNYLSPNMEKGPMANPLIRQAFSLAIDRSGLADAIDGVEGEPLKAIETPALFTNYRSLYMQAYDAFQNPVHPDISGAKKLIQEAHAEGQTVTIGVDVTLFSDPVSAELEAAGQAIGLNVKVSKLPSAAFDAETYSGHCPHTYDALFNNWTPDFPTPSAEIVPPLASIYSDVSCYFSPVFNTLRAKWEATKNGSVAEAKAIIAMMKLVTNDNVYIPMYDDPLVQVRQADLTGYNESQVWEYQSFLVDLRYK